MAADIEGDLQIGSPTHGIAMNSGAWDREVFDRLAVLVGADRAMQIAQKFWLDLCNRFGAVKSHELMRRDAHAVTSTSGMLGFTTLSKAARDLEKACETGDGVEHCLQIFAAAKLEVGEALGASDTPDAAGQVVSPVERSHRDNTDHR